MKEARHTTCFFCSLGCGLTVNRGEDRVHYQPISTDELEYHIENPINRGSLCGKCNYLFELLYHPNRILGPQISAPSGQKYEPWETVTPYIIDNVRTLINKYGADSIGIMLSPNLTLEETDNAIELAKIIGTPHLDYCSLEDKPILAQIRQGALFQKRLPSIAEIEKMHTVLVVGDLFSVSPVLSRRILKAKYDQRPNKLIVLESSNSNTGWFADLHLRVNPGTEAMLLTGIVKILLQKTGELPALVWKSSVEHVLNSLEINDICKVCGIKENQIYAAIDLMTRKKPSLVALTSGFGVYDRADLVTVMCQASAEATDSYFLPVLTGANAMGIHDSIAKFKPASGMSAAQMIEAAEQGTLKGLLNFGVDIVRTFPNNRASGALKRLEFLMSTSIFSNETTAVSHIVLPAAPWLENNGTTMNMLGTKLEMQAVLQPPGQVKTTEEIISLLMDKLKQQGLQQQFVGPPVALIQDSIDDLTSHIAEVKDLLGNYLSAEPQDNQMTLISSVEFAHSGDGSITQNLSWPNHIYPEPVAIMPENGTKEINPASKVRIRSASAETILPVKVNRRAGKGIIIVPAHFQKTRSLLNWEMLPRWGYLNIKPAKVTIEII